MLNSEEEEEEEEGDGGSGGREPPSSMSSQPMSMPSMPGLLLLLLLLHFLPSILTSALSPLCDEAVPSSLWPASSSSDILAAACVASRSSREFTDATIMPDASFASTL
jgi:hypothetical protein